MVELVAVVAPLVDVEPLAVAVVELLAVVEPVPVAAVDEPVPVLEVAPPLPVVPLPLQASPRLAKAMSPRNPVRDPKVDDAFMFSNLLRKVGEEGALLVSAP